LEIGDKIYRRTKYRITGRKTIFFVGAKKLILSSNSEGLAPFIPPYAIVQRAFAARYGV